MKIPDDCKDCLATSVCGYYRIIGGSSCVNFHKALESKLHSHNKSSIKFPNVKELLDEVTFPSWLTSKAEFLAGFDQACVIIKRKLHT